MSKNQPQEIGKRGEKLASEWFQQQGYIILEKNWRHGRFELDLIASRGKMLHFIEVKTRTSHQYGFPEEAVGRRKFQHMQKAGAGYLKKHPQWVWIQYDILSITILSAYADPSYYLCEDIYW